MLGYKTTNMDAKIQLGAQGKIQFLFPESHMGVSLSRDKFPWLRFFFQLYSTIFNLILAKGSTRTFLG